MFTEDTLVFLRDLAAHNARDWFESHRDRYETAVKVPARALLDMMEASLARETGRRHKGKLFRIHRDLRFSKDRTPYNTHVHMAVAPLEPAGGPVWMIGLAPEYFALGFGIMRFDKPALDRFRARVSGPWGAALASTMAELAGTGVRFDAPELKRVPAACPQDHPRAELLRRKGLVGWIDAPAAEGIGDGAVGRCEAGFARLRPLFDLLSEEG